MPQYGIHPSLIPGTTALEELEHVVSGGRLKLTTNNGILVPCSAVQQTTRLLLPLSSPLLEEECHMLARASITQLLNPSFFHRPRSRARLTADDGPMDIRQIRVVDRAEERLK
jgi:hypothetical protein